MSRFGPFSRSLHLRQCHECSHRGYSLLEFSLVLAMGGAMVLALTLAMQTHQLQRRSELMAERYEQLMAAAVAYAQRFGERLLQLPAACAQSVLGLDRPVPLPQGVRDGQCRLRLEHQGLSVTLDNGLQPDIQALRSLHLLDATVVPALALDHQARVWSALTATLAPAELGVRLERVCQAPLCAGPPILAVSVFNQQPYRLGTQPRMFSQNEQVITLFSALGDQAAMGGAMDPPGLLLGPRQRFSLPSPVRDPQGAGGRGVVLLRRQLEVPLTRADATSPAAPASADAPAPPSTSGTAAVPAQPGGGAGVHGAPARSQADGAASARVWSVVDSRWRTQQVERSYDPDRTSGRLDGALAQPLGFCDPELTAMSWDASGRQLLRCDPRLRAWEVLR